MSRTLSFFIITLLAMTQPALAADMETKDPAKEIVYRANLGRAADVKLLIKKGVSPDTVDEKGAPLIALATARKDAEGPNVLTALLDAGADINARDAEGQNALFYAVRQGNKENIQFLLDHGISYYAPDNKGNIARTIAFQQGSQDIVDMLDKFVTAQTEKVNKQYEEYNHQLEERNKLIEEQNKAAMEEAQRVVKEQAEAAAKAVQEANKAAQEAAAKAAEDTNKAAQDAAKTVEPPKSESDEYLETLAPKEVTSPPAAAPADKRDSPQFETDMRNFAFQNCAFQYWSFCRQVKQRSDLSPEEMRVAIDTHREQVMSLFKSLMTNYQLEKPYLDNVSNNAMTRINDNLEDTHSNTYRLEQGVCLMPDLQTRCTDIAETWNVESVQKKTSSHGANIKSATPYGKKPGIGSVGTKNTFDE